DARVRFLVVANPTGDLAAAADEVAAIQALEGQRGSISIEVTVLAGAEATRARTRDLLASGDLDVLHFSGHAALDTERPGASAIQLADGLLTADDILRIPWPKPPGFVFGSACESGGSAAGRRLLSADRQANGLAGAFLSAGVYAYAGFFWPVTDEGAALFTRTFYEALFGLENVGLAFQAARQAAVRDLGAFGDLAGYGAVLYGDAASKHRRDTYSAR
ncbi:MAG TPA: CHAT domain-containing protein, partial [Thermomicrobiales bacterium]|nr:CHAT domain-containing protein [Thermomicrobiales bacterium]